MVPSKLWVQHSTHRRPKTNQAPIIAAAITWSFFLLFLHMWAASQDSLGLYHSLTGFSLSLLVKPMSRKCHEVLSSPGKE